jgi:mannose/fructose/N-acetylgalactosamine-specific phosphotransferase system component IIB
LPGEQDIYRCGVTEDLDIEFWTVAEAVERLPGEAESEEPVFVLTEDLESMWELYRGGVPIREVNLGGLYAGSGRRRLLPYIYLGREDERWVRKLEDAGVRVSAQDLPASDSVRVVEVAR